MQTYIFLTKFSPDLSKKMILVLLGVFGFAILSSNAQENRFFMPVEIRKAYEKGTRSYDGSPGANYWQNTVDYKIQVTIDSQQQSG